MLGAVGDMTTRAMPLRALPDDQPLTTGWVNAALSRLSALGLPKIADWIQADLEALERPAVEEMVRDVLDVTADELGYGLPAAECRRARDRVRFELLALWATEPRYADEGDEP